MLKKLFTLLLCLCLMVPCAFAEENKIKAEEWLENKGLELVTLLQEMVQNEAYFRSFVYDANPFSAELSLLRGIDFSAPSSTQIFWCSDEALESFMTAMMAEQGWQDASPALREWVKTNLFLAAVTSASGFYGQTNLMLSNVFTVSNTYVCPDFVQEKAWMLMEYPGEWMVVAVFNRCDSGVLSASAILLPANAKETLISTMEQILFSQVPVISAP